MHCHTKRNANEESKQAKLVQCKVFDRKVMKAGITNNHHLTPQYLEDMSHDEVVHLQCSSYSILNQPIDMGCNNLVCADHCIKWTATRDHAVDYQLNASTIKVYSRLTLLANLRVCLTRWYQQTTVMYTWQQLVNKLHAHNTNWWRDAQPGISASLKKVAENLVWRLLAECDSNITVTKHTHTHIHPPTHTSINEATTH